MSDSGSGGCCRCCCSFILTSGLTALFMWLSLRTKNPVCSIQKFYVPRLNQTAGNATASNNTIYFDLKLDNENKDKGVYYEPLNLTLYYGSNRSFPVANQTFPGFYQGHDHSARRRQLVDTHALPWAAALQNVSDGSRAVFRVDLATTIRFKILLWKTKKHGLRVSGDVEVDGSGEKVKKKGIRLKSGAPELQRYRARVGPLVIVFTLICLVFIG
ncbi:hypothetical protein NMG60_11037211 [Bertholletia excelsa]